MMKIVIFGLLVVGAMAQFPGMLPGFGGGLPSGAMDMIKDLKPEDIKEALKNMPPEMKDMVKSMGFSEEQIKNAVKNMPEDLDVSAMMEDMQEKMENNKEEMKNKILEEVGQMKEQMKKESVEDFKKEMENYGFDMSEGPSGFRGQILPKITDIMGKELRYQGIDVDDHEQLRKNVHIEIRMMVGAKEDDSIETVREMLREEIVKFMKEDGIELDQERNMADFKKGMMGTLKEMGMDVNDNFDGQTLKEKFSEAMKSRNTHQMMKDFLPMFNLQVDIDA